MAMLDDWLKSAPEHRRKLEEHIRQKIGEGAPVSLRWESVMPAFPGINPKSFETPTIDTVACATWARERGWWAEYEPETQAAEYRPVRFSLQSMT